MYKKKILFTIGSLNTGGAEKVLINYINYFNTYQKSKFHVELFLISLDGKLLQELDKDIKINYLFKGNDSLNNMNIYLKFAYKIYRRVVNVAFKKVPFLYNIFFSRFNKFDFNFIFVQDLYWFSKTSLGKNKYLWIQNNINCVTDSSLFENSNFTKNFNKIVAISEGIYNDLVDRLEIDKNRIIKCNNPIDSSQIKFLANTKSEINLNEPYIVSMGRLVDQKGFDILIDCLSLLRKEKIDIKLVIIGGGENHNKLINQAKSLELIEGTDFIITGIMSNPYPLIKKSKIFICSSRFDGLSTSINEAMSLGIPIISTPCNYGPKEIIGDNEYGIICKEISSKSLMINIKQMLENKELLNEYSISSFSRSQDFDVINIGETLIKNL